MGEADFHIPAMGRVNLPQLTAGKIKPTGDDHIRKLIEACIENSDRSVEEFASVGDLVLDLTDPVAQLAEAGIRL